MTSSTIDLNHFSEELVDIVRISSSNITTVVHRLTSKYTILIPLEPKGWQIISKDGMMFTMFTMFEGELNNVQKTYTIYTWALRKILRIPYTRHITNAEDRALLGCPQLSKIVTEWGLRFFGHITCSAPNEDHHHAVAAAIHKPPSD